MKILYLSCHEVLEYDECKILSDLGHEVFSLHGAYMYPHGDAGRKRPGIPNMHFDDPHALEVALQCSKENMHQELIDMFDVIIVMHRPDWITSNWGKLRNKRVIWRTIGQSITSTEMTLEPMRRDGLQIVRYSPTEARIPRFIGADAVVRFGKDPTVYHGLRVSVPYVVNFTQSIKQRGSHCGFKVVDEIAKRVPLKVFGPGNEDLSYSGGAVDFHTQISILDSHAAYLCPGTHPASYTLNFIEAWMTGIPVVAFGPKLGSPRVSGYQQDTYEVPELIEQGVNGFYGDSVNELTWHLQDILNDSNFAWDVGQAGRKRAIELFSEDVVRQQWKEFLG